jgi:hypothetical protein
LAAPAACSTLALLSARRLYTAMAEIEADRGGEGRPRWEDLPEGDRVRLQQTVTRLIGEGVILLGPTVTEQPAGDVG